MTETRQPTIITYLIPAMTILLLLAIQAWHFHERPYRQDEAWVVHYGIENIQRVGVLNHIVQILYDLPPENFIQDVWVYTFGHIENIVRFLSTLVMFLTLSLTYRLGTDLIDRQMGRLAVVTLGTLSIFMFYTHEARPYAMLSFGTVGFQWALLRFIRHPNRTYFLLALAFAVIPFYTHPFLLYVFAGQVVCILIFVRWNRELYLRGVGLFALIGALIFVRLILNFTDRAGIITYGTPTTLEGIINLYHEFQFNPEALGLLLLGLGLWMPVDVFHFRDKVDAMRFGQRWRKWWFISALVIMLAGILSLNVIVESVTPRNLVIIAPYIALIAAYGLRHLPWQAHLIVALMLIMTYRYDFRSHISNAGYPEMAQYVEANYEPAEDRLVVIVNQAWEWIPIKYFLDERTNLGLTNTDILYVSNKRDEPFAPQLYPPENGVIGTRQRPSDEQFAHLPAYLGEREKLWVIKGNPFPVGDYVNDWIDEHYTVYNRINFPGETYYRALQIIEYRRNPDDLSPVVRYGDNIALMHWQLNDSVEVAPCQTISVDTWWQTTVNSPTLYSSTLVLADGDGQGVVNADGTPGGYYLSSLWQPDTLYFDERQLTIPCDIPAGQYNLLLGLYDIETIENLPVNSPDGDPMGTNLLYLTTLTVP